MEVDSQRRNSRIRENVLNRRELLMALFNGLMCQYLIYGLRSFELQTNFGKVVKWIDHGQRVEWSYKMLSLVLGVIPAIWAGINIDFLAFLPTGQMHSPQIVNGLGAIGVGVISGVVSGMVLMGIPWLYSKWRPPNMSTVESPSSNLSASTSPPLQRPNRPLFPYVKLVYGVLWKDDGNVSWEHYGAAPIGPLCPRDRTPLIAIETNGSTRELRAEDILGGMWGDLYCIACNTKYPLPGGSSGSIKALRRSVALQMDGHRHTYDLNGRLPPEVNLPD